MEKMLLRLFNRLSFICIWMIMAIRSYLVSFKKITLLSITVILGLFSHLYAQGEPAAHLRKKDLRTGSKINVIDNFSKTPDDTTYYIASNIVHLKYMADTNTITTYYPLWTYRVVYKLMNTADTTDYFTDTLDIMSSPYPADCKYNDAKEYATGWPACKLRVLNICATSGTSTSCISSPYSYPFLPQDIELEVSVKSTLLGRMGNINASIDEIEFGTAQDLEIAHGDIFECWLDQRFIRWTNVFDNYATEYELEWVYIPESLYVASENDYFNNYANTLSEYREAFELAEPVRVTTREHLYPFPEEYPDEGKVYFRVRPVGRLINTALEDYDQPAFYPWWFTIALDVQDINFSDDRNWQRVTTFAEDGKYKKVISYYDGLYRSRQSLTHISSDNTVIVAETVYDHEGRGVVQMLPYPEECVDLSYKPDRREDMLGNDWNKYDFELAAVTGGDQVKPSVGSSQYYSGANPFLNPTNIYEPNLYTPDAELYPYTRMQYMMDGTGRVFKTSGVGPMHKLDGGHETKYFYATPNMQELVRLFGSNVGQENHYKKNYVIDANGQISTSYMDQEGRVIATALVGDSPDNLIELDGVAAETLLVDLSDKNSIVGNVSELSFVQFNAIANTDYQFTYRIPYAYFELPPEGPCLACVYQLEIKIEGPGLTDFVYTETITPGSIPEPCEADATYFDWTNEDTPITLPEIGEYHIYKRLYWDGQAALANLTSSIITNSTDVLADLQEEYIALIDSTDCDPYLQMDGHNYDGDVYSAAADMECQGMLHEMINQVSPGGYYFTDLGGGTYNDINPYNDPTHDDLFDLIDTEYGNTFIVGGETLTLQLFYADLEMVEETDAIDPAFLAANWRNEWGAIIAKCLHPEICHYDQCIKYAKPDPNNVDETTSSAVYDLKMTQEQYISTNYSGTENAYMNPQDNSLPDDIKPYYEDPFSASNYSSMGSYTVIDPWPLNLSGGATEVTNLQASHLENYREIYGLVYSIWEFSHPSEIGGTNPSISPIDAGIQGNQGNAILFSDQFDLDTDGDNALWNIYRGSYLQAKTEYKYSNSRLVSLTGYNGGDGCPILSIPNRVVNGNEILDGETLPSNGAGVDDMANDILDNLDMTANSLGSLLPPGTEGDLCYENCENKANLILDNILGNCVSLYEVNQWLNFQDPLTSPADDVIAALDGFRLELINYCLANCEPPLAYAIITDADLDGMEGSGHPLHGAYLLLDDIETALINAELVETTCTDITNLALIDEAGDDNSSLTMVITENCDYVNCFENTNLVEANIADFINNLLGASSPFSIEVDGNENCTYCGCLPTTNTTNTTEQGVNYVNHFPSGAVIALTKDCPISDPCSTLYSSWIPYTPSIGSFSGSSPTHRYYLQPSNEMPSTTGCSIIFTTLTIDPMGGYPNGFNSTWMPVSVINTISGVSNVVQTSATTFSGYCNATLHSPYTYSQYQALTPTTAISTSQLGFLMDLSGCAPELVCKDDTTYTIESTYTIDYETWQEDCWTQLYESAMLNAQAEYDLWVAEQAAAALKNYEAACLLPGEESFTMEYITKEHHYTLYYYDQADNLVQTVPPAGVHVVDASHFDYNATTNRVEWDLTEPAHTMLTNYQYNSLNQPIEQTTPDGGLSLFYYDEKGRITHSQNAHQRERATASGSGTVTVVAPYSRTIYDALGRITQVSERTITFTGAEDTDFNDYPMAENSPYVAASGANTELENEPACSCYVDKQITRTYYEYGTYIAAVHFTSENTRSRVAYTTFQEYAGTAYDIATHYSYDIHGNVKTQVTELNHLIHFGNQRYKRIDYKYDLVSGKVNMVQYQPGKGDKFIHQYTYDADNRLTMVETSPDYLFFEMDAKYYYYLHGPLARMETGQRKVQGSDYAYTLHGWLKGVNTSYLDASLDIGKDGKTGASNPHQYMARDGYGYVLDYYAGDYVGAGAGETTYAAFLPNIAGQDIEDALYNTTAGLYNGNISRMYTALSSRDFGATNPATDPNDIWEVNGSAFHYDQLNRIKKSAVFLHNSSGSWSIAESDKYGTQYAYDANGNLQTLQRKGHLEYSGSYMMDNFTYHYASGTNKLTYIDDAVTGNSGANDPDFEYDYDNDLKDESSGNYSYDEIGNLIRDVGNGVDTIKWSVYGKVRHVIRSGALSNLEFVYDAAGQRVMKIEKTKEDAALADSEEWIYTVYSRDAQGNIMTIYNVRKNPDTDKMELYQGEVPIYGSSRLGVWNANRKMVITTCVPLPQYSRTNIDFISTCDPENDVIPYDPDNLEAMAPSGFEHINLFDNVININHYEIGSDTNTIALNPHINIVTVGGADIARIRAIPVIGQKQYEFTDHLGNVLLTVHDVKKGFDTGSDGFADYYEPIIQTTSDYYPFGMPMPGRYSTAQQCHTEIVLDTFTTNLFYHDFESPTITYYGPISNAMRMTYDGWAAEYDSYTQHIRRSGPDKWIKVQARDDSYGATKVSGTVATSTGYTFKFDVDLGSATSVIVDIYSANSSGVPQTLLTTATCTTSVDNQTIAFTSSSNASHNKIFIRIHQSDNSATKYFYIDDTHLYKTSDNSTIFNTNLNSPTITNTQVNSYKYIYNGWTAWQYSELYDEDQAGGNTRTKVVTTVSNHGAQQYFDGFTANQWYTLAVDIDLDTSASQVKVYLWDVNGAGTVSNERVIATANSTGHIEGNFKPIYSKVLVQIRRSSGSNPVWFYMDNFAIYDTVIANVYQTTCDGDRSSYRWGFNGQEKDNEVYGEGNCYTADFWEYDPRTCRRWNLDPMAAKFPHQSPYVAFDNNPIYYRDPKGLESEGNGGGDEGKEVDKTAKSNPVSSLLKQTVNNQRYDNMKPKTHTSVGVLQNNGDSNSSGTTTADGGVPNTRTPEVPITPNKNTPQWVTTTTNINGTIGIVGSVAEYTPGTFRLATAKQGFSPKFYGNNWGGNQYATTFKVAKVGKILGYFGFGFGTAMDGIGVYNYYANPTSPYTTHPAKAGVNLGFGLFGILGGPYGACVSGGYFLGEAVHPQGWPGLMNDGAEVQDEYDRQWKNGDHPNNPMYRPEVVPFGADKY